MAEDQLALGVSICNIGGHVSAGETSMRTDWMQAIFNHLYPMIDGTVAQEGQPLPRDYAFVPHHRAKHLGWSHYGVMIPALPAPHQFFSLMSIIGSSGALAFDTDHALHDSPRRNATLVTGTAATHPAHFQGYSMARDCQFADDGSHIQFGQTVILTGQYPCYQLKVCATDFELAIEINNTDKVTWFVKLPIYDHLSVLSTYRGQATYRGQTQQISGLCTFEHAACVSPYLLHDRPLANHLKIPVDFFTYHIINLDERTQLLLNDTRVYDAKIVSKAFVRGLGQYNHSYRADFEVLQYQAVDAIAPDGVHMRLPQVFRWVIYEQDRIVAVINGEVDTPMTYGLGSGYVGGYTYSGQYQHRAISGRGYIEYIDRRVHTLA